MRSYRHIAALGSSFAAGPGIEPVEDPDAMRSKRNYAHLVAGRLGAELTDLTVAGATTTTILHEPQTTMSRVQYAPQISGVPQTADLVTVTAGGNDLQFATSMLYEAWVRADPTSPMVAMMAAEFPSGIPVPTATAVAAMSSGLIDIVTAVRSRAPGARVILVDYLTVIGDRTRQSTAWPFDEAHTAVFRDIQDAIAEGLSDRGRAHRYRDSSRITSQRRSRRGVGKPVGVRVSADTRDDGVVIPSQRRGNARDRRRARSSSHSREPRLDLAPIGARMRDQAKKRSQNESQTSR